MSRKTTTAPGGFDAPLFVDRRTGSKELAAPLLKAGVAFELTTLEYGDAALVGHGPDGWTPIGVERKGIKDLAQSLLSGRLVGHQVPGLLQAYPFVWLVVEGVWREGDDGYIEIPAGKREWRRLDPRLSASGLTAWLLTLELRAGLRLRTTRNLDETAAFLGCLRDWWTEKAWADHRSHLALYEPPDASVFDRPSVRRQWAAILPGIGIDKSKAVERHFKTAYDIATAGADEWRQIPGIGKTLAERVTRVIRQT